MSTSTKPKAAAPAADARTLVRILDEGYGPGAWHGPDLKAALADLPAETAFWRPAPGRHNIAEIALHHAWCVRAVRGQLSPGPLEPFPLEGEDWFEVSDARRVKWPAIVARLEKELTGLNRLLADIAAGRAASAKSEKERFDLVLGVTCHAVYHAGQVQLLKRLRSD
jgi:DinB family protein